MQEAGEDYNDSYSPVVSAITLRLMLTIAFKRHWTMRQIDVKTAYLNGNLDEDVYMYIPEGFERQENKVCHLMKSLYGLCQSGKCWYRELDRCLREIGCENGNICRCVKPVLGMANVVPAEVFQDQGKHNRILLIPIKVQLKKLYI
jgi:hypothetical protein